MTAEDESEVMKLARAAARAEGALDGAERIRSELDRWFSNALPVPFTGRMPAALAKRLERVLGELERAQRSKLEEFTKQFRGGGSEWRPVAERKAR